MQNTSKREEPVKPPQPIAGHGTPPTVAAQPGRKNPAGRIALVLPGAGDSDELTEDGYGHGV